VASPPRALLAGVVACFFLSGATGLVYEVLWVRMLGLVFGHTVFAVTTVLAAFMAGLGLGSWVFGRIADRRSRLLRLYGLLEIGVGVFCLLVPLMLPLVESVYRTLARGLGLSFLAFGLAQFALVFLVLLPPTTLMGATLPVLSRLFATETASLGRRVGFLYALNTFGAVVGAALAGYVLLPGLGMQATLTLAAGINVVLGMLMIAADRRLPMAVPAAAPAPAEQPPSRAATIATLGLGLAGAASMIYQVAWTRALSLVIGSSTYAFTAMLVAFLLGLALGSALFSRLFGARPLGLAAFGAVQIGVAAGALATLPLLAWLPDLVVRALGVSLSPGFVLGMQVVLAVAAMLLPTLLIGAAFPCALQVAARGTARVGLDVGRLYAVNTLGAILGTVVAGFALIPWIGAHGAVRLAVAVNLLLGIGLVVVGRRPVPSWRWAAAGGLALALVAGLVRVPAWNPAVMAAGASVYARHYQRFAADGGLARATADSQVLFYRDGLASTVSVHREGATTSLRVNGKTDASNGLDMHTQLMLGHLPLLLQPQARSVLVVGLASAITAAAVAAHPVERLDVVEIEPAMVQAATFFTRENREVLRDPRVHLSLGDARNFLLASDARWDVIVSEPSNPWIGGVATLFTEEFYALARSRLAPGGLMVQWIDGYTLRPADLRMVVKTFRTAFPAVTIWNAQGRADFLLVGTAEPRPLDLAGLQAAWDSLPHVREDLRRLGFRSPWALLADFVLAEADAARLTLGAELNDDDRLPLEFSAPLSVHGNTAETNYRMVRAFRTRELPLLAGPDSGLLERADVRYDIGLAYLRKDLAEEAAHQLERALAANPAHAGAWIGLGRAQIRLGLPVRALESLQQAARHDPRDPEPHVLMAGVWQSQQAIAKAVEAAEAAVRLAPEEPAHRVRLAGLLERQGRAQEAVEHYLVARPGRPRDPALLQGLASAYGRLGRAEEALATLEAAAALEPTSGVLLHSLGRAYLAVNRPAPAVQALTRAVARAPALAQAWADLGLAHLGAGDAVAAIAALERALVVDPAHAGAAQLLGETSAQLFGGKTP
jgi:spermidine synthase